MSRVLFTHSYFYPLDHKQWRFKQPYPPLMTIQAAAIARENGFDVSLFDSNLKSDPTEITVKLNQQKPTYCVLIDDGFNYLTKMCLSVMREAAFSIIGEAKRNGCIVIVNSSDSTDNVDLYLKQGADYIIRGEMDESMLELLESLESDGSVNSIDGLSFQNEGKIINTNSRTVLRDLDKLPMPAWDLIDVESYRAIWEKHHGYFSLNIATTRGCPFKCNWCAKPIYGNRYHSRSPEHVVNEIEFLLKNYQPDHLWMCDDIFGLKPGWVSKFKRIVRDRSLNFRYKIQSRVDLLLEENAVQDLADSGAETVWVGAESGSQKILDAMDKGTTVSQIGEATRLLKQRGIKVGHFLQFGYTGETTQDIQATLQMVLDLMPDEIGISISYPLPGTKFYEKVKTELKEKQHWTDSDDLAMMFTGTFPPAYYKVLHRYMHNRYRIQRGINQFKKNISISRQSFRNFASMIYNIPLSWIHRRQLNRLSEAQNK